MDAIEDIRKVATEKYNRLLDLSLKITDDFNSARRLDIEQLRNLLLQISVISFSALGFSIPVIGFSSGLKNPQFFILGIIFLLIPALGGLWYSAFAIEGSLVATAKGYKQNNEEVDTAIHNQVFLMRNPDKYNEFVGKTEKFVQALKVKNLNAFKVKRDKFLYFLLTFLTVGIGFIVLSLLPLNSRFHYQMFNDHLWKGISTWR